ncbi:carbon-nitrogen hydrolase [Protomyces lactucae-debilis]|uniref:Carbon-nitrogen hydrolase n=1 Tax=Protomyces lactucae-debilis TaxID=2754530 RepID=A0A1Y2EZ79_PROLT|nr:carbon-nitrogen hydrolase [Protomyces lactucae-debilis]ORY76045.1 carbon-nitrogen hydrolase [Protomyces lactucae-debilis]
MNKASEKKTDLIVFPEATIGGYPKHSTFGIQVGLRTDSGRQEYLLYYNASIEVPSPTTDTLAQLAKETNMSVVIGVIERERGTLYCTLLYIDAVAGLIGKHRKIMPTGAERLVWGFGDESTIAVHDMTLPSLQNVNGHGNKAKVSGVICWENYQPLLRYHMYRQGTQIYTAPTVDARTTWLPSMQFIAQEGRCFVLSACAFAKKEDFPADHAAQQAPDDIIIAGGSCIISPLGEVLAGPLREEAGLLFAEIDLDDNIRGALDMDVTGHYSRSDIFQLHVKGYPEDKSKAV